MATLVVNEIRLFLLVVYILFPADCKQLTCEEVTIPMCQNVGYNLTYMPNMFNHGTQAEAALEVHQFWPLVEIKCSPDLRFFLCSMYAPVCDRQYMQELPPCKTLCERARKGCAPLMRQYGFRWPERMDCSSFPEMGDENKLCMDRNITEDGEGTSEKDVLDSRAKPSKPTLSANCCTCRPPFVSTVSHRHSAGKVISIGGVSQCGLACNRTYFSTDQDSFSSFWIGLWAVLCFLSTAITVATFLVDMQRFKYPERPIIFLSACYLMVSLGYIIRFIAGFEKVACDSNGLMRYQTSGPASCTIVFLLIYFFSMASSLWWVILAFTWFLAAGMKWSNEAITNYAQYYHVVAWLIPAVQSITVLALSTIDGDPVSGICFVGTQNLQSLLVFVIIPLVVFLVFGTSFLISGFYSLIRIRKILRKHGGTKTDKLEKLMIRIGVFSVLYTVPATICVACHFYEFVNRGKWEKSVTCSECHEQVKPDHSVFIIKYFMALVVGITSGFWIWSGKTIESWRKFYIRLCNSKSRDVKYSMPTKSREVNV